jgi:hypothetical protein
LVELKAYESEVDYDSESNPKGGKRIIDVEPSATVTTTKVHPSEPKEPEEGDPGGYWWPPTYSNRLLVSVFYSTCLSVLLYNCEFYTFGAV